MSQRQAPRSLYSTWVSGLSFKPEKNDLPKLARAMVDVAGVNKTLEYAQRYGGRTLYFKPWGSEPFRWGKDTVNLVHVFGKKAAKAIVKRMCGKSFTMPSCGFVAAKVKAQKVVDSYYLSGLSTKELSSKYSLHERRIQQILKTYKKAFELKSGYVRPTKGALN